MPTYTNVGTKRLVIAGVQTIATAGMDWVYPDTVACEPGETCTLSEADAVAQGDRVQAV